MQRSCGFWWLPAPTVTTGARPLLRRLAQSPTLIRGRDSRDAALLCRNANGDTAADMIAQVEFAADAHANERERMQAALAGKPLPPGTRRDAPAETSAPAAPRPPRAPLPCEIQPAAPKARTLRQRRPPPAQMSPAAMLREARTADEIAAVLCNMPEDHQRLRVRMWSEMSAQELAGVEGLTAEARKSIVKVRCRECFGAAHALGCCITAHRAAFFRRNTRAEAALLLH